MICCTVGTLPVSSASFADSAARRRRMVGVMRSWSGSVSDVGLPGPRFAGGAASASVGGGDSERGGVVGDSMAAARLLWNPVKSRFRDFVMLPVIHPKCDSIIAFRFDMTNRF